MTLRLARLLAALMDGERDESPLDGHWAHLRRRALVYVRQSTVHQVERNTESAARQYALRERAVELCWPTEAITADVH